MSVVSIRFNDDEEEILKNYVKSKGINLSQHIKNTIFEGTLVTIPFEEAIKEWDIQHSR